MTKVQKLECVQSTFVKVLLVDRIFEIWAKSKQASCVQVLKKGCWSDSEWGKQTELNIYTFFFFNRHCNSNKVICKNKNSEIAIPSKGKAALMRIVFYFLDMGKQ